MDGNAGSKILFVINSGAGANDVSWQETISNYFTEKPFRVEYFEIKGKPQISEIKKRIDEFQPTTVVAVGGDGTVTMVAKLIGNTSMSLGIIPAGSANGMAKELDIPEDPKMAMAIIEKGNIKSCDAIRINEKDICIHLSDLGLNAQLIKYFDEGKLRGKLGYARVILKTLWHSQKMQVSIMSKENQVDTEAFMVVLANASKYGTGAVINPEGKLDDGNFEVVIVHKLAISQLIKMLFKAKTFNPKKIEIFHATSIKIKTRGKIHFQIDGEYQGKVNSLQASILPGYINLVLPADAEVATN